jgi:very-short-patch-repair endonuclease
MAEEPDDEVHVTTPARRRIERRPGLAVHCTRNLGPEDVVTLGRIPTTRQPRTLLDLADVVPYQTLRAIADDQRRLDPDALRAAQARAPNKAGAPSIARLLEAGRHHTRSEFERRFLRFCRSHGLPMPDATNVVVAGHQVDALYARQRLAVELDGRATHARRAQMRADRGRDADVQVAGHRVLRLVWEDLDRDEAPGTRGRLLALLAAAPS